MFFFVLLALFALVILGGVIVSLVSKSPGGFAVSAGALVVFLIITAFMSATTIGARSVGIQTAFGKYKSTMDSGIHWTSPWSSVEQFSTQVQYLDLDGQGDNVAVTYSGGGGGAVNATVRWRINTQSAENLWKKYRTFDNVQSQLVNSSAKDSFRVVVSKYTPNQARDGENLRPIAEQVKTDLSNTLAADGVIIDSVSIKGITLDKRSQDSLDKVVTANNDIERAKAEQVRAKIDAETAKIRAQGGSLTPAALTRYCLEVVNSWDVQKNGPLPAGFNCVGSTPFTVTSK